MASQKFSQSAVIAGSSPSSFHNGSRVYEIRHTIFVFDYNISSNNAQLLHVDNSALTPGKPDLTFHAGADKNAPVVAVCKFVHFSRHMKVGFGNPQYPNDVVWEDVTAQDFWLSKYRVAVTIGKERKSFLWKRSKLAFDLRLVDEQTDAVVAQFQTAHFSPRKSGSIEIFRDYGPDFDLMALTSVLGFLERLRRGNAAAPAAAGGVAGGGGGC